MPPDATLAMLISMVLLAHVFKLVSLMVNPAFPNKLHFLLFSPVMAISTYQRNRGPDPALLGQIFLSMTKYMLMAFVFLFIYREFNLSGHWRSYSYLPVFYFSVEALTRLLQLMFSVSGKVADNFFNHPLLSRSLTEFWSCRWNLWISDWYRDIVVKKLNIPKHLKAPFIYIFSGLWHDLIFTVPYYMVTGQNFIGRMTLYFVFQAIFIFGDRKLFNSYTPARRLYFIIAIVGPFPVFLPYELLEYQEMG